MRNMSLYLSICNTNKKYMKNYDKNKNSSYIQYENNLYAWAMPQKFPVINFVWIKDNSQLNEDFIKKL